MPDNQVSGKYSEAAFQKMDKEDGQRLRDVRKKLCMCRAGN